MAENGIYNILDFGADPSGKESSTKAIQQAIDAAGSFGDGQGGVVLVPPGTYLCHDLQMHSCVRLQGCATWGYRNIGNCVLRLEDTEDARCMINLTGAFSCTVADLVLQGTGEAEDRMVHGVYLYLERLGRHGGLKEENIPTIRNCKMEDFSGDGIHFHNIWCFRVASCQMRRCRNGLYLRGVDGFIIDNWFSRNREWGIFCDAESGANSAVMVTSCRIEWNGAGGFLLDSASKWQITNCNFDKNFGPAIHCASSGNRRCPHSFGASITGNIFNRCGYTDDEERSFHLIMDGVYNMVVTGNTFLAGADDNHTGPVFPKYSIKVKDLKSVVIANNVLQNACTKQQLVDHGGHYEPKGEGDENSGLIYANNVGGIVPQSCYADARYFAYRKDS